MRNLILLLSALFVAGILQPAIAQAPPIPTVTCQDGYQPCGEFCCSIQ